MKYNKNLSVYNFVKIALNDSDTLHYHFAYRNIIWFEDMHGERHSKKSIRAQTFFEMMKKIMDEHSNIKHYNGKFVRE